MLKTERGIVTWAWVLTLAWLAVLYAISWIPPAQASRTNISGLRKALVMSSSDSAGLPTGSVTSTAFPVGDLEDVAIQVRVNNLATSESVTITTCARIPVDDETVDYSVPVGIAPHRTIDGTQRNIPVEGLGANYFGSIQTFPVIGFPPGVEQLQFVATSDCADCNVELVASGQ